jgi:hypothetical protein
MDESHSSQIKAGTEGRLRGHKFEEVITSEINALSAFDCLDTKPPQHLAIGNPATELLNFIANDLRLEGNVEVEAWWVGGLATTGEGHRTIGHTGLSIDRSKSDVIIRLESQAETALVGVGAKACNNPKPTNAQLFFSTASAWCDLLRSHLIDVSDEAEIALKMFCGDKDHRPLDSLHLSNRVADPNRWYWEELPDDGRSEWENLFSDLQGEITRALLSHAYPDDLLPPRYIIHQRHKAASPLEVPIAIFEVNQLVDFSIISGGFSTREYQIRKGTYRDDPATHLAPRFGFVQMQRGGQRQNPTQLQFNLQAGYFNHLNR